MKKKISGKSGKKVIVRLNKTNLIVIGVCVLIVVAVLIIAFGGKKSLSQEGLEAGSQEGTTEEQKGFFDFFLKLFDKSTFEDFDIPDGGDSDADLPSNTDTNDSSETDNQQESQICGNTCAQGYNQKPYPDCSCYLADTNTDTDGDGVNDNADAFPNDATESEDTDGDGVGDNADAFPNDPDKWQLPDCDDSDNGKDVHIKGTTEGLDDCCTEEAGNVCLINGISDYIMEHYCNATNNPVYEVIKCPAGEKCVANLGKCVPESEFFCNASDWEEFMGEWSDPATEATCTDVTGTYTDQCAGNGRYIYEYNCIDNFCVQDYVECSGPDQCVSSSATHCTRIPADEILTNTNSQCYGRTRLVNTCWCYDVCNYDNCEDTYLYCSQNGFYYVCAWDAGDNQCWVDNVCAIS